MNSKSLQDLKDLLQVLKACKTEEDAKRAGVLVSAEEIQRKFQEINWAEQPILIRSEQDTLGIGGNFPSFLSKDGTWKAAKCHVCDQPVEIGETYKKAPTHFYVAHDKCLP